MAVDTFAAILGNSPDTLFDTCLNYLVDNITIVAEKDPETKMLTLREGIRLPVEICERLFLVIQQTNAITDEIAHLFRDRTTTSMQSIKLTGAKITDIGFKYLMEHAPYNLELINCECLSPDVIDTINNNSQNLVCLKLGPATLSQHSPGCRHGEFVIIAPKLKRLIIHQRHLPKFPVLQASTINQLTYLDLSECNSATAVKNLGCIPNLEFLILYNVHWLKKVITWIKELRTLRHLDISQCDERHGKFVSPNSVLSGLVESLPKLESLDISGTNLAGSGSAVVSSALNDDNEDVVRPERCDIPGLVSRVHKPLRFLGLYGTLHGACKRHDIPALMHTGDTTEKQILVSAAVYMDRPAMMMRILNDLYYLFRNDNIVKTWISLSIVLDAMEQHIHEKHIQIAGSASLFYVVKGKEKKKINIRLRRRIVTSVLVAMEAHPGDDTMLRNCCLTLCQFDVPRDVLFVYERLVVILLNGVADVTQETFVQRIVIYLLNSLACQVNKEHKQFLGDCGAIAHMLLIISDRLERHLCDDVLEVAWSTMWNVTDETPQNCQRFLESKGMEFFLSCLQKFPNKAELLRNMMGLLGNVAEVPALRPHLMGKLFLTVFYKLLDSTSDGIEVSYNAAGVLAHMASDGVSAWIVEHPSRAAVLARMAAAMERWDLRAERNINYRSFEPILRLLRAHHTSQCQHWAVWALANLTTVYPEKYCRLVEQEGGIELLKEVTRHPTPYPRIKELARTVLRNCRSYQPDTAVAATPAADSAPSTPTSPPSPQASTSH